MNLMNPNQLCMTKHDKVHCHEDAWQCCSTGLFFVFCVRIYQAADLSALLLLQLVQKFIFFSDICSDLRGLCLVCDDGPKMVHRQPCLSVRIWIIPAVAVGTCQHAIYAMSSDQNYSVSGSYIRAPSSALQDLLLCHCYWHQLMFLLVPSPDSQVYVHIAEVATNQSLQIDMHVRLQAMVIGTASARWTQTWLSRDGGIRNSWAALQRGHFSADQTRFCCILQWQ